MFGFLKQKRTTSLNLSSSQAKNLEALSRIRGESADDTLAHICEIAVNGIPTKLDPKWLWIRDLDIRECGIDVDLNWLRLGNGRVFYGPRQRAKFHRFWRVLSDLMPEKLQEDQMGLAWDVTVRYSRITYPGIPKNGGIVIEAGAYHGLKAIRFSDLIGKAGKVLAIELMPENYALLRKNVEANGLSDRIITVNSGLWSEETSLPAMTNGLQAASLVHLDGRTVARKEQVNTTTLKSLLKCHAIDRVDFLNIQVNGAELEVLRGLGDRVQSVRLMRIVTRYERDGRKVADDCIALLQRMGCRLVADVNGFDTRTIYASPEQHASEFEWIGKSGGNPEGLPALRQ